MNGSTGRWRYPFVIDVSYPRSHYKALAETPVLDVDEVIDADMRILLPVIRDYTEAAFIAEDLSIERSTDENSTHLTISWTYEMWTVV